MKSEKNKLSLNWLLNCIVKGLYEYMVSFVLYFFILLFFELEETRNFITSLKNSEFFPLNIIFLLIFGIILIFDGISILMDKIKKILVMSKQS